MRKLALFLMLGLWVFTCYSWNATGHKLAAQIAYDNLTPEAKEFLNRHSSIKGQAKFIRAATWMDYLKSKGHRELNALHYIDLSYSNDGSPLPIMQQRNALSGLNKALILLKTGEISNSERAFNLKLVIHLVADIHQPLHTINFVSRKFPKGDLGGNLFRLGKNPIASNLHQYWDRGAGFLMGKKNPKQIKNLAKQLERQWPCEMAASLKTPEQWIKSSNELALRETYTLNPRQKPNKTYQHHTQYLTQKQLALSGCRLAKIMNALPMQTVT